MPAETLVAELTSDGSHLTLLIYVGVALSISFLCSMWEAVLLSVPLSHLQVLADAGRPSGRRMLALRGRIEQPISAILTLNTIAHTVGAAGAGAEATLIFGSRWFGVISAVLTLAILIISEIVPKTLGTTYCRGLTGFTELSLRVLMRVLAPVVAVLERLTRLLRRGPDAPLVTRAELQAMAQLGAEGGDIGEAESLVIRNLLHLGRMRVRQVMTPRVVVSSIPADLAVGEALERCSDPPYSRIPIYGRDHDDIDGYVLRHELLEWAASGRREAPVRELARPLRAIPVNSNVAHALDRFIAEQDHIVLVVDEHGGTAGILTLEDAIESLLGREILDETDTVADLQELARRRFARRRLRLLALRADPESPPGGEPPRPRS